MNRDGLPRGADAVVVGAGIVGACCADALSAVGLDVVVLERHSLAGGATAAGEGNILVSDKVPGPELLLAQLSRSLWLELGDKLDRDVELDPKGGLVVATTQEGLRDLEALAAAQRRAGVEARAVSPDEARELEPHLSRRVTGAVHYPEDLQVQPVQASAAILGRARQRGAIVRIGVEVTGMDLGPGGRAQGVWTSQGRVGTGIVVNAAGAWSAALAAMGGVRLPVVPRRGHILVTEPLPSMVHHKVYDAGYVGTVGTGDSHQPPPGFQVSSVVEATASGTILIGSSRELVGYDRTISVAVLAAMASRATALFPVLARARILRAYLGFRPYSPDHLPIIGADPDVPGLVHATGHEGAGIGLAPATGALVAAAAAGSPAPIDPFPFHPGRPSLGRPRRLEAEATHG